MKLSEKGKWRVAKANVTMIMLPTYPPKYRTIGAENLEFESDDFEDFEKEVTKFFTKLAEEQKPLPADMARVLNEHFWELT